MGWRIAVTSVDGVLINEHFGHAQWFYIIDAQRDGTGVFVERRGVSPWCQCGADGGSARHKDAEPGDGGIADSIRDCRAVLTAKIGVPARKKLEMAGISVFEEAAEIEEAVRKLAAYYTRSNTAENV